VSAGARVLVVDDDPQLREALTRALELDGYAVETASNGVKALEAISGQRPDVMVLDVMMPYVGGLDVCRTLRDRKDRLPILVLTARDEVGDRVAGLDAGADDYLTKPFALEELRARLRALLRRTAAESDGEDAVLTEIAIPAAPHSAYAKYPHPASHYAVVGVAAKLDLQGSTIAQARIAITGVGDRAFRADAAEKALTGISVGDGEAVRAACAGIAAGVDPRSDVFASGGYRAAMADVFAARAIGAAANR